MISFEEYNYFPIDTKKKVINMVFNANIESELEKIEKSILIEGKNSEYIETLLENITSFNKGPFGYFYEVKSLICVSAKDMGYEFEDDNS